MRDLYNSEGNKLLYGFTLFVLVLDYEVKIGLWLAGFTLFVLVLDYEVKMGFWLPGFTLFVLV